MNTETNDEYGIINMNTSEITKTFPEGSRVKVTTPEQLEYNSRYEKWKVHDHFLKYYDDFNDLPNMLSPIELNLFIKILKYIEYETNRLIYNDEILTIKAISELINYDYDNLKKNMNDFYEQNIIKRSKSVWDNKIALYVNPNYCSRGNKMLVYTVNLFMAKK